MNRKILVSILAVLSGLFIYTSCTKLDTTDLGNELIPAVDNVNTFDTLMDVVTDNVLFADTTRIASSQPQAIGVIADDPEFGKTQASLYLSLSPATYGVYPFIKKDSVKIDSVVLSLSYNAAYGDSFSVQQFDVFEIDPNSTFKDSIYRITNPDFATLPAVIGKQLVNFQTLNDSLTYINAKDTIRTANELRIKLDTAWARHFVNYDTAVQYKSDSAFFNTAFKGLAIKVNEGASPAKNGLAYFNISSGTATKMTFYCRVTNGGKTDTIASAFTFNGRQANLVSRTPAHGYLTYLNNGAGNNDDKLYLQSSPGSYATVKIPNLENLSNRVIYRAELMIEQLPSAQSNIYTPPSLLFIDAINNAGDSSLSIRNDFVYTSQGTGYDEASLGGALKNNKFTFNLSRYVQSIVTKKFPNRTLRVYAPFMADPYYELPNGTTQVLPTFLFVNPYIGAGRVVVGGGSHPTQKMRLRIIYSKI